MCRDGIPPKIALPSSYLRLAPPELSASIFRPVPKACQEIAQVFSDQCPRLVKKCSFEIPFEQLDHYPRVSKQKKWNSTGWFCPPRPPPSTAILGLKPLASWNRDRKQAGSRLKSHQVYADSNGILWPGMLTRHLLSLEPFFLKLDTWWRVIFFSLVDELVCFNEHNETSEENEKHRGAFLTVVFQR